MRSRNKIDDNFIFVFKVNNGAARETFSDGRPYAGGDHLSFSSCCEALRNARQQPPEERAIVMTESAVCRERERESARKARYDSTADVWLAGRDRALQPDYIATS